MELYFTCYLSDGTEVELVEGGRSKCVTSANVKEYVSLVQERRLRETEKQTQAIRRGLASIVTLDVRDHSSTLEPGSNSRVYRLCRCSRGSSSRNSSAERPRYSLILVSLSFLSLFFLSIYM